MRNHGIGEKDTLDTLTDGCLAPIANLGCQFYLDTAFQMQYLSFYFQQTG